MLRDKLLFYFRIWIVIFIILVIASIVRYHAQMWDAITGSLQSVAATFITLAGILYMLSLFIPR